MPNDERSTTFLCTKCLVVYPPVGEQICANCAVRIADREQERTRTMTDGDRTMTELIPTKIMVQAIRDLHARTENCGDWLDGIPESFKQIRDLRAARGATISDPTWVLTVECIIKNAAIKIIAEGTICV